MFTHKPCVFIVDDDEATCKSMHWLMKSVGLDVEYYTSSQKFIDDFDNTRSGCLLLDIRMPEISGLELQEVLLEKKAQIPIIFITSHHDVPVAVKAMKKGALDFLTKPFNEQQLIDLVHRAISIDDGKRKTSIEVDTIAARFSLLSAREKEVLECVVAGKLNKIISYELGISSKTVEMHRAKIMKKMHASSLAELVKMVMIYKSSAK